uniref:Uncharacterized protein n=1 Tax=Vannella robusta TaxID=1487602 RepID=A0A7S4ITN7_9EUKA|mmetsp:Transcript_8422/g.10417  ORF Transcript_8422/g.10417 Transcript_8422/m.10417 type:complete len:162 (+) Transcript_8422:19-504(+)
MLFSGEYVRRIEDNPSNPFIVGVTRLNIAVATGKIIAYSYSRNSLMLFDINGRFNGIQTAQSVVDTLMSQDGKHLVTVGENVCFWNVHDLLCTQRVNLQSKPYRAKFSVDENLLFVVVQSTTDKQYSDIVVCPVACQIRVFVLYCIWTHGRSEGLWEIVQP